MNPTVYRAAKLDKEMPEAKYALPVGFPFIVDDDNLEVEHYALLYLDSTFRKAKATGLEPKRKRTSIHTVDAAAYDLVDFLRYLVSIRQTNNDSVKDAGIDTAPSEDAVGPPLHNFTIDDVLSYRDDLYTRVSKQTHETLSDGTCSRRVKRVLHYAKWLERRGLLFDFWLGSPDTEIELSGNGDNDDVVRPLSVAEWYRVRDQLGPLPSERQQGKDERPARNRVASELAICTALRVDEVAKLTVHQILALRYDDSATPHTEVDMRVTQTKRLVPRTVYVPMYLVRELQLYIDGERREAMAEAEKFWRIARHREPSTLFVNGADAHQHAGKPMSADVLSNAFHTACMRAGLMSSVEKIDPLSGERYLTQVSSHHFHDLRHTFTIWRYYAEKSVGNSEPWKMLQSILGHKYLQTTLNTYLRLIPGERREVNRKTFSAIRERFSGH